MRSIVALACLMLCGCAQEVTKTVAVVADVPKPALARECDPAGRREFPKVKLKPNDQTPPTSVDHALETAKKRDAENADRERLCYEAIKPQFATAPPSGPIADAKAAPLKPPTPTP